MQENVRNDFNKLIECCLPAAENHLQKQDRMFYPFGVILDNNGQIILSGIYEGNEFPSCDALIEQFKTIFEKQLRLGEIIAYSIIYDSMVKDEKFPEKIDAVATRMRHRDSDNTFFFYFPYKIKSRSVQFFESIGQVLPS